MYLAKAVSAGDGRLFDTAHQFCKTDVSPPVPPLPPSLIHFSLSPALPLE
jgi:hypothetical protein